MTIATVKKKKNTRHSGIELLRIISIFLILFYHLQRHAAPISFADNLFLTGVSSWGILGVNCFVAISSYFLLEQKFRTSKIAVVFFQMLSYCIVFLGIRAVYDYIYFDKPILSNILSIEFSALSAPFWVTRYWFVWTYVLLCIISPFLNLFIENLSRENHIKFLACMSFILIYGTFGDGTGIVCDLAFFVYIYFAVAFIKKYPLGFFDRFAKIGSILMAVTLVLAKTGLSMLSTIGDMVSASIFSTNRHSAYMVIMALFVFCAFKNSKIKQNKIINFLALQTLGVYLFHENGLFLVSDHLYTKLDSMISLPASLLVIINAVILFVAGSTIEFVRRMIFDKPIALAVSKTKLCKWMDTTMEL